MMMMMMIIRIVMMMKVVMLSFHMFLLFTFMLSGCRAKDVSPEELLREVAGLFIFGLSVYSCYDII